MGSLSGLTHNVQDSVNNTLTDVGDNVFGSVEELVRARTPEALQLITDGSNEAIRLSRLAELAASQPLQQFAGLDAFEEQQGLLGLRGDETQEQLIGDIPVSDFDRELQRRQQETLLRQRAAAGELGGGATIQAGQELAGQQRFQMIQNRLAELEPLVAASRAARSAQSGIAEQTTGNVAQLQSGLGTQLANIRLGTTAPLIEGIQDTATLSGLQGISRANQRNQQLTQLANLAGILTRGG